MQLGGMGAEQFVGNNSVDNSIVVDRQELEGEENQERRSYTNES